MIEAGVEVTWPFNPDISDLMSPTRMAAMMTAIFVAMRHVQHSGDVTSGIQLGLELRSSQAAISPSQQRVSSLIHPSSVC